MKSTPYCLLMRHLPHDLQREDCFVWQGQWVWSCDPSIMSRSERYMPSCLVDLFGILDKRPIIIVSGSARRHIQTSHVLCKAMRDMWYDAAYDYVNSWFNERWFGYYRHWWTRFPLEWVPRKEVSQKLSLKPSHLHHSPLFQFESLYSQITRFSDALRHTLQACEWRHNLVVVTSGGVMRSFAEYMWYHMSSPLANLGTLHVPIQYESWVVSWFDSPSLVYPGIISKMSTH